MEAGSGAGSQPFLSVPFPAGTLRAAHGRRSEVGKTVRAVVIAALLGVLCAGALSAAGKGGLRLGLEFGDPQVALIIRPAPLDFRIGYSAAEDAWLFLSADYRIVSGYQLVDFLHLFVGAGLYVRMAPVDFGLRIPFGLQAFLLADVLEVFVEAAPTVQFVPGLLAFRRWQGWFGFTLAVPRSGRVR